jgi:hypothetical protein
MHVLGGTQNGIHGTGLDAFGAADTLVFADNSHPPGLFNPVFGIQGLRLHIQQVRQGLDGRFTTGRAFVDRTTFGDGFGVGPASGVAALAALGLGQQGINLLYQRVALDPEAFRGKTQQAAENHRQGEKYNHCYQDTGPHKLNSFRR